jgi:hypothetical protein
MTEPVDKIDEAEANDLADWLEGDDYEIGEPLPPEEWPVRRSGRPSLTAPGEHSPRVTARLNRDVYRRAVERARSEGKPLSSLLREAVEAYLDDDVPRFDQRQSLFDA